MSFNNKLTDLLKTDPRFVDDEGEIVLAAVQDAAWKTDRDLVKLLLSDKEIKAVFFSEIEGHWIFDLNKFIDYLSQKDFLDNSYTRFRNRIGLTIGGKYLRERGEVVLAWPYKDCYLEGGQTQEEEKRKEIFFNEMLAQDEINRLLDPKVLTNFKRYVIARDRSDRSNPLAGGETASGIDPAGQLRLLDPRSDREVVEEKVTDFKRDENGVIRENLIIKGNNLLALHTLLGQFRGRVKLIYIDPPYNTGNDTFGYNDNFNHSTWLTFMKNRLDVAKALLRKDGSIWINIDDDEAHYLKVLCDDIFGRENFVANVVWEKKYTRANDATYFSDNHDHILVYAKSKETWELIKLPRSEKADAAYSNPDNHPKGVWKATPLHAKSGTNRKPYRFRNGVVWTPPPGTYRRFNDEAMKRMDENNEIWFGTDGKQIPQRKSFLVDVEDGITPTTIWKYQEVGHNHEAKEELKHLFPENVFSSPKPERLLEAILHLGSRERDLVLDFFVGSGTTAAVAHKMGRQYIGIEQMDYTKTISVERLKKVIKGEQGGISKAVGWQGGGNFITCELMKYNEAFMERIQAAKTSKELLKIWREMAEGSFLNWYVNPAMPDEAVKDFEELGKGENGLEKQKRLLAELLDKNQLYVNLSEIDDAQFKVSEEDKRLNRAFYGMK